MFYGFYLSSFFQDQQQELLIILIQQHFHFDGKISKCPLGFGDWMLF